MARKLGDVLHLLLGEEEPAAAAAATPERAGVVRCHVDAFDVLETALAWNLAAAHATLAGPTTWISERDMGGATPYLAGLDCVAAAREGLAAAAANAGTPSVWWTAPEGTAPPGGSVALHVVSRQPGSLGRCYRRLEQAPDGPDGAAPHTVVALVERSDESGPAAELALRFGNRVRVLVFSGEAALYRSWVSRSPICLERPDSPEAVALFAIAQAISSGTPR